MTMPSSASFKFATGQTPANARPLSNVESFAALEEMVRQLGHMLDRVITRRMSEGYKDLDILLAQFFKNQDHPLSSVRVRLILDLSEIGPRDFDHFFITEKREWWWIRLDSTFRGTMPPTKVLRCEQLRTDHAQLFVPTLRGADPTQARIALHLERCLLQVMKDDGKLRQAQGQQLIDAASKYDPWVNDAQRLGFDPFYH